MPFTRAGQLARQTPTARADDPLGLVAENLRASTCSALPILDRVLLADEASSPRNRGARVLGLVEERDLSRAVLPVLAQRTSEAVYARHEPSQPPIPSVLTGVLNGFGRNGHAAALNGGPDSTSDEGVPRAVTELTARLLMRHEFGIVPAAFSLENALLTLDRYDCSALPVVDDMGGYMGMISRADVVAAMGRQVRPPTAGGMATPLGVWLTTGYLNAGAPAAGLFLSGLTLAFCMLASNLILLFGLSRIDANWAAMFESGRVAMAAGSAGPAIDLAFTALQTFLFLAVLRMLPMAGIHAAEHQTVWAMERGLPLTPECVAQMPRAHPRCGTNLAVLGGLITIIFTHLPQLDGGSIIVSLLFVYFTWRSFGTFVQENLTTRPASRKQLESGIKAGKQLLAKYQDQPHALTSFGQRLFNSGIALCGMGMAGGLFLSQYVEIYLARLILR